MWLPDGCKLAINQKKKTVTSQFTDTTSTSNFFDVVTFLLLSLVTGTSFMSMSWLVLELWQFSFIRDWPDIRKLEIPPSELCPISEEWGKLGIPNLAQMSLIKICWKLQNTRVTACTVSELFRENQQGGGKTIPISTQIRVKKRLQHRCFLVKFAKFLRTPILRGVCERLLLYIRHLLFFIAVYIRYWMY